MLYRWREHMAVVAVERQKLLQIQLWWALQPEGNEISDQTCLVVNKTKWGKSSKMSDVEKVGAMVELLKGAEIVVGLDIGTAYSCFAFPHKRKPKAIYTFYDWPRAGGDEKPSPKTLSAIYYGPGDATTAQVRLWGFPARVEYARDLLTIKKLREQSVADMPEFGTYFEDFKCHLASNLGAGESSDTKLPKGFTVTQVIADYLREMGAYIVQQVANYLVIDFTMDEVQWCVTVPSNCGDHAQKLVEVCMERAGYSEVGRGCCGEGLFATAVFCNAATVGTCSDPSTYMFFDSLHPTEKCYKAVADQIFGDIVTSFGLKNS